MERTINSYLLKKKITLQDFSNATGISYSRLSTLRHKTKMSINIETVVKIWEGTKNVFGEGLPPWDYMDIPDFRS